MNDTVPSSLIMRANLNNFSTEEKARREEAIKNKDFYYSRQQPYLLLVNQDVDPVTLNVTFPLIRKRSSLLYSRPLVRDMEGPGASIAFLEKAFEDINIDAFLQCVDLASEMTGTGLVHVGLEEGVVKLRLFDASEFSAVADNDTANKIPKALSLISMITDITGSPKDPNVKRTMRSEIWTDEYITTFTDGIKHTSVRNELGFLPFAPFKGDDVYGQFLGHSPCLPIRQLNEIINQQLTNMGYMIKMQSATPIVLTGFQQGEGVVVHPGKAISMPAGADAKVLTLNPKIADTLEEIRYLEKALYETTGIPKVSIVGDEKSNSGKELMIKWFPLIQAYREKALRYEQYELDLANMILKVAGYESIASLNVKYPEENILPSISDTDDAEFNFKYGISTPIDEVLRLDPTMDEAEAEALVRSNKEFNDQLGGLDVRPTEPKPEPEL